MRPWFASLCLLLAMASAPPSTPTSIHRMIVGKKAFESLDTRQITTRADGPVGMISVSPDGKYVVYVSGDERQQVSIIRTSGGHPTKLMNAASMPLDADGTSDWAYNSDLYPVDCSPWSPDSRLIALPVVRSVSDDSGTHDQKGIIVFSPLGMKRALFTLPSSGSVSGRFFWSPDARRIACEVEVNREGTDGKSASSYELFVCDFARGTAGNISSIEQGWPSIESWGSDGKTLRYTLLHHGSVKLCEIPADGGPSVTVKENYADSDTTSPDGRMKLGALTGALTVEQVGKPETIKVLDKIPGEIIGWTPDSRFIVYARRGEIRDESGSRSEQFRGIWLAAPMSGERNHICAAFYVDETCVPSFSADCTKMAFTSRGNLHIADMAWTKLTPEEKADAGIPLTEEEEKDVLTRNAKQIGVAMEMYADDWDGGYPSGDIFVQQIGPYAYRTPNLFFRPGTDDVAFQYIPPGDASNIGNPSETVVGIFDVGYQWQIILYVDGHVKVVPKAQ